MATAKAPRKTVMRPTAPGPPGPGLGGPPADPNRRNRTDNNVREWILYSLERIRAMRARIPRVAPAQIPHPNLP